MKSQVLLLTLLFASCNLTNKIKGTDAHHSENSLTWPGTYEGTLPCADCSGIQTELVLNKDKTFFLYTEYQGKSKEVFSQKGSFQWNDKSNGIQLEIDGTLSLDHQYLVTENGLLKLNRQGNKIAGELKDNYKLVKNTSSSSNLKLNEHMYWVNSREVACMGVGPMRCMQVQKSETVDADKWQLFYENIKGFDFNEGYIYKLVVREIERPKDKIPADGSSKSYELMKILDKNIDHSLKLNHIWALASIKGAKINPNDFKKHPQLEINLSDNRVMGNDGCNSFTAAIKTVNDNYLEFNGLAGTKMACLHMEISDEINKSLNKTKSYQLKNLELTLYDSSGSELLKYKKVD